MKCELIHSCGSDRLILIFAGWSTSADFYKDVAVDGYDVMVASDYSDMDFPKDMLRGYSIVCLFAWSLGVFAASRSLPFERIALAVAVNGTERHVDDSYGIQERIFKGTADGLNERNLMKFRRRMSGQDYDRIKERFSEDSADILSKQLLYIGEQSGESDKRGRWDCAYISTEDAIFPHDNQLSFWQTYHPDTERRENVAPHFVDMAALVSGIIAERASVGEKFRKALPSYDSHADAQKKIARHLADLIPQGSYRKVLEIGAGSGLFSSMFAERFRPEKMDFIDLYELPRLDVAPEERYMTGDAEDLVKELSSSEANSYDAIISASSIQWLVDHESFFRNVARLLKDGGIFACSTFTSGNLHELLGVNPFCLVYRSRERLRGMLEDKFSNVMHSEEEIIVEFPGTRQLMLHLQKTGVGGNSKSTLPLSETLHRLPSRLTYKPFYVIARK